MYFGEEKCLVFLSACLPIWKVLIGLFLSPIFLSIFFFAATKLSLSRSRKEKEEVQKSYLPFRLSLLFVY